MVRLAVAETRGSGCRRWRFRVPVVLFHRYDPPFRHKKARGDSLYFIIGLDAFREIGTWKNFPEIFPLCNFIVTSRPGSKENDPLRGTGVAVKKLFCYDFKQRNYRHRSGTRIYFMELTDIAISASEIRGLVEREIDSLLGPSSVETYIKKQGLYHQRRDERENFEAISSWDKTLLLTRSALERKARDLVVLEVRELTSIADYFIVCSGSSDRQVQSIAQGLKRI